jgi:hypothetical protein
MENIITSDNIYNIYNTRFEKYKDFTTFIKDIKLNDKIGRIGYKKFCVYQNETLQGVKRWWYLENKSKTLEYLHELFDYYFEYLENIISIFKKKYSIEPKNNFIVLINNNITYQEKIILGLNNLMETYKDDDKQIISYISKIKMIFNDFKTTAEIIVKENKKLEFNIN